MSAQEIEDYLNADGPGRTLADLTPEELAKAQENWAAMERNMLAERVYTTAVAFKEAEEDKSNGKWVESARWADYMNALRAHAGHFVRVYLNDKAKENNQCPDTE